MKTLSYIAPSLRLLFMDRDRRLRQEQRYRNYTVCTPKQVAALSWLDSSAATSLLWMHMLTKPSA